MIFDVCERGDASPKKNQESDFEFLNRSARPEMSRVRDFIESITGSYTLAESKEIIARIKSGDDAHFKSAIFELVLHEALVRLGCTLTPHPELENGSKSKPDFLVTTPNGEQFYLEAVLASQVNEKDAGAEARKGNVIDVLAKTPHENFMLDVNCEGAPATQPGVKKLVRDLMNWLDSLNPDEIIETFGKEGVEATPVYEWEYDGWFVSFRPIPLKPERRGKSKSLIGAVSTGGGIVDDWTPIRNAVKYKGSKYGELNKPLLVAVNLDSFHLDRIDEMQALFGQERFVIAVDQPEQEPRFERVPNGAWYGKSGPQYTRVSGLWIFNDLSAYNVGVRRSTIYFNPWAVFSLPEILKYFPHASLNGKKMEWVEGASLSTLFGLKDGWPE